MNNKGFELSINMLVVIILGIAMLGVGMSLFYNAFDKTQDLRSNVDSQTQARLNALLDDGSIVVIPQKTIEGKRGEMAEFSLGITNIHPEPKNFTVHVTYGGSSAYPTGESCYPMITSGCDPFDPFDFMKKGDFNKFSICENAGDLEKCASDWVIIPITDDDPSATGIQFELNPNQRKFMPVGINVPKDKKVLGGQYIFNVDICLDEQCVPAPSGCHSSDTCRIDEESRYDARHKVVVNI